MHSVRLLVFKTYHVPLINYPGGVTKKGQEGLNGGLILQQPVGIFPNQAHGTLP
jgi:hypothetical protein